MLHYRIFQAQLTMQAFQHEAGQKQLDTLANQRMIHENWYAHLQMMFPGNMIQATKKEIDRM